MAFVTLGGVTCNVVVDSFVERPPVYQGGRERMRAGNQISTEATPMRVWDFQNDWNSAAEEATLRAVCPRGDPVAMVDPFGNSFTVLVDFGDTPWPQTFDGITETYYKRVSVHVEQAVVA